MKEIILAIIVFSTVSIAQAQNPIVPNMGLNDPHIRIFNDTAYLYASHDKSMDNKGFLMEDWWIWSSPDLVNWTQRSVLDPSETYIGAGFSKCWATDIGTKDGKYFWYFSQGNDQTGLVVGDSPTGPWKDVLGKPLLTEEMTPTHEYDISIFEEEGEHYIIFGVWDYYIAKLGEDMMSLAEKPRKIPINNPRGPYNPDGKNKEKPTDDKPFMHQYNGKYYLSWGCFYAMSDQLYGPYEYAGKVINEESFVQGHESPTWPNGFLQGRHGSFFEWHNQWYYAYCDMSQTGNRWFRDTFISYVHYLENGEMAPIRIDSVGVGRYRADLGLLQAEDYFRAEGIIKKSLPNADFAIGAVEEGDYLIYPSIEGLEKNQQLHLKLKVNKSSSIEIRRGGPEGKVLARKTLNPNSSRWQDYSLGLEGLSEHESLCFVFKGSGENLVEMDSFRFE
ncbi:glycoside hydrolase [Echinicola pacifica]|uniref:Glycoside hydrolase n=1 Tax=Echinicola pacifica TaxID=346377 RepID=A0A918UNW4_9BACT|nr:family 43 glycosylhydrolase [Echinicola pacifica]GGZ25108.1 glycoside hydrolase [Echinicola pacifica]